MSRDKSPDKTTSGPQSEPSDANTTAKRRKRFIAGAVCPECRAVDRLVVDQIDPETQQRTCVACGFADQVATSQSGAIPRGKAEKSPVSTTPVQTVRLMDPKGNS